MATLNLLLTTLVAFSCKLTVDGKLGKESRKLGDPPSMRYQLSNEIEPSTAGDHSQSQLSKRSNGFQPLEPIQLGWQPLKIHSDDQTRPNQKRQPEKSEKKKYWDRKETSVPSARTVGDIPGKVWVWNPLKQPKLMSNLTKVGGSKTESLLPAKETKLSFFLNGRYPDDRRITHGNLKTTERKDNFFRGVLVLEPNGKIKFLLQTNPSDMDSKAPENSGHYLATSWRLNDLGVHGQNVYAGVGEDGGGYVGIGYAKPSRVLPLSSSVEHKSKLLKGDKFGSSDNSQKFGPSDNSQKGDRVKTDNRLLLSSNFKLVKGSTCRYLKQDDKLIDLRLHFNPIMTIILLLP